MRFQNTVIVAATLILLSIGASAGATPIVKPKAGPLKAAGTFAFKGDAEKVKEKRQSLSGIACPKRTSGPRTCLVVFDEGVEARHVTISGNSYVADGEPVILVDTGKELDAEAAATDGRFYYVTGSHSTKRDNCESAPGRRHVIRFALDHNTGRSLREPGGKLTGYAESDRLWTLMGELPEFQDHLDKCLGDKEGGVNIEGLAIRDGRLFFGFRGPAKDKKTLILSVDAVALFEGGDLKPAVTRIVVGGGRGIRDLLAVKDGILVLTGPDDDNNNADRPYGIAFWDGKSEAGKAVEPRALAQLNLKKVKRRKCDKEIKPEALAVLDDSPARYRALILSDGMCDGGPLLFDIKR